MSIEHLTKLVHELVLVIEFHELEAVDSRAAELIEQAELISQGTVSDEEMEDWFESIRVANMVKTRR